MEFNKSKVYTVLNADQVKAGSKGFFADNLNDLKHIVAIGTDIFTLIDVESESEGYRFRSSQPYYYALFYLVKEPEEKVESEVTVNEWDNNPRLMKVWDDNFADAVPRKVIHILRDDSFPVVTADEYNLARYQHCVEIEED